MHKLQEILPYFIAETIRTLVASKIISQISSGTDEFLRELIQFTFAMTQNTNSIQEYSLL